MSALSRRAALGVGLLALTGCAPAPEPEPAPPVPSSSAPVPLPPDGFLTELESTSDATLGVFALATGSGRLVAHRADERFAFCSVFKALAAAAVLRAVEPSDLDTVVRYAPSELMASSSVTRGRVRTGMSLREVCAAAVQHSDGTAGNLLLHRIGGPGGLTAFARSLGDDVTRMDRYEPDIVSAEPGDPRDTSSPRALAHDLGRLLLGDALPDWAREHLRTLMTGDATEAGAHRLRAGLPAGWPVADKTGTGRYGTANDIAVIWPPTAPPVLMAVLSRGPRRDAEPDEAVLARVATHLIQRLLP